jgi:predicted nucleic acid-binding protein
LADRPVVIDASAGAKLFLPEAGQGVMHTLYQAHLSGEVRIVVPDIFVYEVLRTVGRYGSERVPAVRAFFAESTMRRMPPDDALIGAAIEMSAVLGCDLYDAFPPALASMLAAPLYSADRHAHGRFPGVVLVGADDEAPPAAAASGGPSTPTVPATPR